MNSNSDTSVGRSLAGMSSVFDILNSIHEDPSSFTKLDLRQLSTLFDISEEAIVSCCGLITRRKPKQAIPSPPVLKRQNGEYITPVPAPRLVGIELNPGPPKKAAKPNSGRRKRAKRSTTAMVPLARAPFTGGLRSAGSVLQSYIDALQHPFVFAPPRCGFGTMVPYSQKIGFVRGQVSLAATDTCFFVSLRDSITSFLYYNSNDSSSKILNNSGAAGNVVFADASNAASIRASSQTARVITGGLRIYVRYPATALRGSCGGVHVCNESQTNLLNLTYSALPNISRYKEAPSSGSGEVGLEVQFRPSDYFDYQFNSNPLITASASSNTHQLLVSGTGWPAGQFTVHFEAVVYLETTAGIDLSGEDPANEQDMLSVGLDQTAIGRAARAIGTEVRVGPSFAETLALGLSNANRMSSNGYPRLGIRG